MINTTSIAEPCIFEKELAATFQLEVEGKKGEVFASHIEEININFHPYGYEAYVRFTTFDEEEINQIFAEEKMMKAALTFKSTDPSKKGAVLLELKGIVNERNFKSRGMESQKKAIRVYEVHFKDPATMSWSHHFPIKIFVDQTMKDVIDAEKNPLISIKYDWALLNEVSPITAFSLEFKKGLPPSRQVSFYSFLNWYLYQRNGILEYSHKENSYTIAGKKKEEGKPAIVPEFRITAAVCQFPEPSRYQDRMIKHSPETEDHVDKDNPNSFQSVRRDAFDDVSYRHFPEQITQAVHSKLSPEKPSIQFYLKEFASSFGQEQLLPGQLIEIKGYEKTGGEWCDDPIFKNKVFRLTDISFRATHIVTGHSQKNLVETYQIEIQVNAESKDETYVPRPEFQEPSYPFSIPGKIFCQVGDKPQTTFNMVKHEKAPLGHYLVKVPLAGAEKKVVVPFIPDFTSGQHYFPLCKDQQVMLSMYFQTAKIERVLDWQPLARLPLDVQANQTVFASNGKDKYLIQKHEYKNGKDSVFIIKQSSSPDQTQTIQIQEKQLSITVEEKGKNTVLIVFDRESGLTLKVKDEASGVTQQSQYNATGITHTSEGKDGKSIFVQKPDSISIDCKKFNVKCEEGIIEAAKTLTQNAKNKLFLKSPLINALDKIIMGG